MPTWETACWPYPEQTDARLRLGSGVGLSSITEFSFNLSLTRCIKNTGQQERHPATSSSQSDSDTPTSCLSQVFALKNPVLRTTEQVLTSLGWPHFAPSLNLPWLAPLSFLFPTNKPCSLALDVSVWFFGRLRPNSEKGEGIKQRKKRLTDPDNMVIARGKGGWGKIEDTPG